MSHHTAAYFPTQRSGFVCQFVRFCHWDLPVLADPCSKPCTVTCPPKLVLEHLPALHFFPTQFTYCAVFSRSCQMMSTEKGHGVCQFFFLNDYILCMFPNTSAVVHLQFLSRHWKLFTFSKIIRAVFSKCIDSQSH